MRGLAALAGCYLVMHLAEKRRAQMRNASASQESVLFVDAASERQLDSSTLCSIEAKELSTTSLRTTTTAKNRENTCCAVSDAGPGWDAVTGMSSPRFEARNTALVR